MELSVISAERCQQVGCEQTEDLTPCFFPDNQTDVPDHYYCQEHAPRNGFCCGCGQFSAGTESFDFAQYWGGISGYCESCSDTLKDELGESDEDEDDYYYYGP